MLKQDEKYDIEIRRGIWIAKVAFQERNVLRNMTISLETENPAMNELIVMNVEQSPHV